MNALYQKCVYLYYSGTRYILKIWNFSIRVHSECGKKQLLLASVTSLGDFCNFPVTNFLSKVARIFGDFLGYFENGTFCVKTAVAIFGASFGGNWATF